MDLAGQQGSPKSSRQEFAKGPDPRHGQRVRARFHFPSYTRLSRRNKILTRVPQVLVSFPYNHYGITTSCRIDGQVPFVISLGEETFLGPKLCLRLLLDVDHQNAIHVIYQLASRRIILHGGYPPLRRRTDAQYFVEPTHRCHCILSAWHHFARSQYHQRRICSPGSSNH